MSIHFFAPTIPAPTGKNFSHLADFPRHPRQGANEPNAGFPARSALRSTGWGGVLVAPASCRLIAGEREPLPSRLLGCVRSAAGRDARANNGSETAEARTRQAALALGTAAIVCQLGWFHKRRHARWRSVEPVGVLVAPASACPPNGGAGRGGAGSRARHPPGPAPPIKFLPQLSLDRLSPAC